MKKHTTKLKDIAKHLGISVPTVSRALNDKQDISLETRTKVQALAKEWNYQPNQFAINFKNQQTYNIGVIIPQIVHHFFSNVINGIMETAEQNNYNVMLFQSNESYEQELKGVATFQKNMIDGLIISLSDGTDDIAHLSQLQQRSIPVVMIDKVSNEIDCAKVICDDFQGAYLATEHLIEMGKTHICHITGSLKPHTTRERHRGFTEALKDNGLEDNSTTIEARNLVSREEGYHCMKKLLESGKKVNGVFCATDPTAVGAMKAIKEAGYSIPMDIAVIGFSNWEWSTLVQPTLSSIKQPDYDMGKKAVSLLIDEIEELHLKEKAEEFDNVPIKHDTHIVKTELIIRESSFIPSSVSKS